MIPDRFGEHLHVGSDVFDLDLPDFGGGVARVGRFGGRVASVKHSYGGSNEVRHSCGGSNFVRSFVATYPMNFDTA